MEALGNKLVAAINQPFMIDAHRIDAGISVGISLFPNDGASVEDLPGQADSAMYQAKRTGGNACCFSLLAPHAD